MQRGCRGEAIGRSGARCDLLGDIVSALDTAEPGELSEFYASAIYHHVEQIVEVSPLADRVEKCVRGGIRTLTTRLQLSRLSRGTSQLEPRIR